jgi:glutamate N-acetyltransferase/amino-acid N-acetyltransferase
MLGFITTDVNISKELLQKALSADVVDSFNMISVDGDTSTNDTLLILANGLAGNAEITEEGADYDTFCEALHFITTYLAKKMAGDGEGATALFECKVVGAASKEDARILAKSVICSSLTKAAIFGHDANWGRVAAAAGKCGVEFDQYHVDIDLLGVPVLRQGLPLPMDEDDMLRRFEESEIKIAIALGEGTACARVWTCDLTHEYITINGDYRT